MYRAMTLAIQCSGSAAALGDLDELAKIFGFAPPSLLSQATQFRQGEALFAGGFAPVATTVRVRQRVPTKAAAMSACRCVPNTIEDRRGSQPIIMSVFGRCSWPAGPSTPSLREGWADRAMAA